jgi:hypothetical protein
MKVNLDAMPWDLVLTIGGTDYATRKPSWADVQAMAALARDLGRVTGTPASDPAAVAKFEVDLRSGVARFFPDALAPMVNGLAYDTLIGVLTAGQAYFGEWLKKKREAALAAISGPAPFPTTPAIPGASSR